MATREEPIAIDVDGHQIVGTFTVPNTLVPGVLFVHGWGGSQRQYVNRARDIAEIGCICLTFDLRGHESTRDQFETVSREQNLRDVVAAFDLLAAHPGVDASAMAVVGSSYGGYLAAILASLRRVKWLALRVPALYKDVDWNTPKRQLKTQQDLDAYRRLRVQPQESRALAACAQFAGDALMVESEHDDIVPHQVIVNYLEALTRAHSVTYRVMEGADHGLSTDAMQVAYTSLLVDWFREALSKSTVVPSASLRTAEPAH